MGAKAAADDAPKVSVREARRLETRARLFEAAVAEIGRRGLAGADVTAIANAVGVVRGTFYFHFPTKEHVLIELQRQEEAAIVAQLRQAHTEPEDLESAMLLLVRRILDAGSRMGTVVFRDMLGLQFSSARPVEHQFTGHPVAQFVVELLTNAQQAGRIVPGIDVRELAVFFCTGLYALLATGAHDFPTLSRYVTTIVKGMEIR